MRPRNKLPVLAVAAVPVAASAPPTADPALPETNERPGLSLMQVFAIIWAYRKHAVIIAATILLVSATFIKFMHKTYSATATLMVDLAHRDPLEGVQTPVAPLGTYMATEIQLMQSPEVLLPVIDQLQLTKDKIYTAGYRGDGSDLREWVKENLVKDVDVEPGQAGSQLIYVTASARYPYLAAQIANTIADVYLKQERARVSGPASARAQRYSEELAELKNKVRIAQDQVTAFRQRTGVTGSPTQNNNIDTDLLASLEKRLQEAEIARRAAEVKAATDQNLSTAAASSNSIQNLKTQIDTERAQLAQMRAVLGERHPKVLELENQIAANQRNLQAEVGNLSAGANSDLAAARALEAKLKTAVAEQRAKVLASTRLADEGTKYMLELESAQNVYKRALDGYDQIMFASDNHFTNVTMVSRAVPPQKAAKPNKIKLLMAGALMAVFLGLAGPIAYELLINRRVRCRDDFERDFAVPVLIEFDAIPPAGSAA